MKMFFTAALAGALALSSSPASARETVVDDGNSMLSICTQTDIYSEGYCLGYIRALSAGVDVVLADTKQYVCYGDNVTMGQIRDVVVSYLRRNPAKRHENSLVLVGYASIEAWPCKGGA